MDVISLTQNTISPRDLLRRRFVAVLGRSAEALPEQLPLGEVRRTVAAGSDVVRAADSSAEPLMQLSGVAGDVRVLADGRRQIIGLRLPGDILHGDAQEAVVALTQVEVVDAAPLVRALGERSAEHQLLRRAWVAAARVEQALLRDQIVRLGRLSAYERMAHMLLETHERLAHVGFATASSFHLPIRQEVVADLLGLSVVHLSRTTQQLRRDRLAQTRNNYVTLMDRERLAEIGNYVSRFAASPTFSRFGTASTISAPPSLTALR